MVRIYIVRHAESISNTEKIFSYKKYDYPLTDKGRLQTQQTTEYFMNTPVEHIYSSPLIRGIDTANAIGSKINVDVSTLEELREVNIGNLEGPPASLEKWNIHNKIVEDWFNGKKDSASYGGEDYHSLYKRTHKVFTMIASQYEIGNVVIVGHGGMFIFTLSSICYNVDIDFAQTLKSDNCSITIIDAEYQSDILRCRLIDWGSTNHLSGIAAEFVPGIVENND